jgi:hypothetical protein
MSRSARSASSKPLFRHSARHTQPRGYVASGDDELTANDSLTFELGRRLNIGSRRILTRLIAAFLLGQGWEPAYFSSSSLLLGASSLLLESSDALFCMYVWKQHFLSTILMRLLRSLSDNEFSTSVLQLSRSELLAKGTCCHI